MHKIVLALLASAAIAAPVEAAPYLFTVSLADASGAIKPSYSFLIDNTPTPDDVFASPGFSYFRINNVTFTAAPGNPTPPASPVDLLFFDDLTGGAFSTADFVTVSYFGAQLFDGPLNAPRFNRGPTSIVGALDGSSGTITISAVPEPATWAFMIAGFGAAGLGLRQRRNGRMSVAA